MPGTPPTSVLDRLFETAEARFGRSADLVVVNAGRGLGGSVKDCDRTDFANVLKVNVIGALALMQKAARQLVAAQKTRSPRTPPTSSSSAQLSGAASLHSAPFTAPPNLPCTRWPRAFAARSDRFGVRVSLIEPGIVVSGFQDVAGYSDELVKKFHDNFGPLLYGEDIANAIHCIVSLPAHVHLSDVVIRPTRQDYP